MILALMRFGPGPALLTYWIDIAAAHFSDVFRKSGIRGKILLHRFLFNLGCCALSITAMNILRSLVLHLELPPSATLLGSLLCIALSWFLVNTTTVSLAIAYWMNQSFRSVWREGLNLYLLNFLGSAAVAGLIEVFSLKVGGILVPLLLVPIAVVFFYLYSFYITKYEQAKTHVAELEKLYLQTIEAMASAVDAKDRYTHGHIRRVQVYAEELAKAMGINDERELLAMKAGALLHDIGKLAIPEYILNKPTVLTESEFEKMKAHPAIGAAMLQTIEFPYPVMPLVRSHHERWDGKGYPDGLSGEEVPLPARILALADCFDALTTDRPYRSPMPRPELIEFFRSESGKAYDPAVVSAFIDNIERIEGAAKNVVPTLDLWGTAQATSQVKTNARKLERVQPTVTYGRALQADPIVQRELLAAFEFARTEMRCFNSEDVLAFMGSKLRNIIAFDAAAFFIAQPQSGMVVAEHVTGPMSAPLHGLSLQLEQKLSGWVAANNQALCNLPPFPDFLSFPEPRPEFQISAIAPLHRNGVVLGSIALYREARTKFSDEEFRRLELLASQTALALSGIEHQTDGVATLFDPVTEIPNGFQLHLMFDQLEMDATRYEYPIGLLSLELDNLEGIRKRWGHMSGDEVVRAVCKQLSSELRDTDMMFRYATDHFVILTPKLTYEQTEALKSRLQSALDHSEFPVRSDTKIPLAVSIGVSLLPSDGKNLEKVLDAATRRMGEDKNLRMVARTQTLAYRALSHQP